MGSLTNTVFDERYRLGSVIGEGPYATVYGAVDSEGQDVAVKVYDPAARRDAMFTAFFRRDIRTVQAVGEPDLLPILAYGVSRGSYYLVSPIASVPALATSLTHERLLPADVARLGERICRVLASLHRHGLVHAALKPTNVFVAGNSVLVTTAARRHSLGTTLTPEMERYVVSYLSPEQIAGRSVSPATDIYSLGVMLYEAYSGVVPYIGSAAAEIAQQHLAAEPDPPRSLRAGQMTELEPIILRCLARWPADRYSSAEELAGALAPVAGSAAPITAEPELSDLQVRL